MNSQILIYACSACGAEYRSPVFPVGWSTCQGHVFCPDCQNVETINRVIDGTGSRCDERCAA
ncbi:MAG: hypothetical protein KDE32_09990 [Novosphingobium sp.]|nr:hypothetical protein [Novosphingobium sp.]